MTTRELQDLLQVDRTTIYRMADSGRVPAIKVGSQWRFPRRQVEGWLETQSASVHANSDPANLPAPAPAADVRQMMPLECVQLIQDVMADALGVTVIITDLQGRAISHLSNPCGLYKAPELASALHAHCTILWQRLAQMPALTPTFVDSELGLLSVRGLIRTGQGSEAMLVVGGIAPAVWPPDPAGIAAASAQLEVEPSLLARHIHEVFYLDESEKARVLTFVQRMADVVAHILLERQSFFAKLQEIAALTKM